MTDMTATIDETRLAEVFIKDLSHGSHRNISDGMCVMEAASWIAGEPWSDHPACVCPVIGSFLRSWNDALPDDERNTLLKPLIPRVINTRGGEDLEHRRALMAADWLVRVNTSSWLRLAGLTTHADALAALPEITSMAQVPSIRGAIESARIDASAASSAAASAASSAAASAAASAARSAARLAAWSAAWSAAWLAAWSAALSVAESVAVDKLTPVKAELQQSALLLIGRMIEAKEVE